MSTTDLPVAPDLFDPQRGAAWKWLSGVVIVLLSSCAAVGIGTLARSADALPTAPSERLVDGEPEETLDPEAPKRRPGSAGLLAASGRVDGGSARPGLALVARSGASGLRAEGAGLAGLPFVPFDRKRGEWLGGVRLGLWPAERRATTDPAYANPAGFYVVTDDLRRHAVSPHFTLGEFAGRGGPGADGTSYVVLDDGLVRKLERVLAELGAGGLPAGDLRILSAFRAPSYNAGVEGAAPSSRHQFGDAADVVVDADGDGRMDDLNRDGRVDRADVRLVADAVERVERQSPELVGGLGLYDAMGPSGPFLHIDVRGRPARWGPAGRGAPPPPAARPARQLAVTNDPADAPITRSTGRPTCRAQGAMAVLCAGRSTRP
jgi:hypothetical protein